MWAREVLEVYISSWFQLTFEEWVGFEEVGREGTPGSVDGKDEGTGRENKLYIFWSCNKEAILSREPKIMGVEIR